jgi:polyhydroxyalkanoate synthase
VLIVAAPIKRPYIWDLAPAVSAVRFCLGHGLNVALLEWRHPKRRGANGGLAAYADKAITEALAALAKKEAALAKETEGKKPVPKPVPKPVLMGHSLGGTLAAIHAALHPENLAGLVLLSSPLCLPPGASTFRDALATVAPAWLSEIGIVPGSFLTQLSATASPATFVWSRLMDAAASAADPRATDLRRRIERWALDEFPLSGQLVREVFLHLYLENRLCQRTLAIGGRTVDPARIRLPTLAVANAIDDIAPPASMAPFLDAMAGAETRLIEYPGEAGVVLQHLGVLVGHHALTRVWPEITTWIKERSL